MRHCRSAIKWYVTLPLPGALAALRTIARIGCPNTVLIFVVCPLPEINGNTSPESGQRGIGEIEIHAANINGRCGDKQTIHPEYCVRSRRGGNTRFSFKPARSLRRAAHFHQTRHPRSASGASEADGYVRCWRPLTDAPPPDNGIE
jgi:hypothetical protein